MSFGDWSNITPETMRSYSEEKLLLAMQYNAGGARDRWAQTELSRRQSETLGRLLSSASQLIASLETATNRVHEGVAALAIISEQSKVEVKRLVVSSLTVERLTKRLVWLTVVLAVLTSALVLDVGNKFRQEYFSELPPPSAPRSPIPPPR